MLVVVDANVLCSALLAEGKTVDLLFSEQIEPIAPEMLFTELKRHEEELLEKTKLSEEAFNELLALFGKKIRVIPSNEFEDCLHEANDLLKPHTKDTEYVALALKFNCPLWSKEKLLKKLDRIKVLDADEVANLIKSD